MAPQAEDIARELFDQHERRERFASIPDQLASQDEAYAVQEAYVPLLFEKNGSEIGGYKIALSSKQTQEWLKIDHPCSGQILASRVHQSPHSVRVSDWVNLGIETEVCVILNKDLPAQCSLDEIQSSLRSVHCAYEIVEDRGADLTNLDAKSLTADNAWNEGIVIGPGTDPGIDLSKRAGRLRVNGHVTHEGTTRETIGENPLYAVKWLAENLGERGKQIKAGHAIITGSIIPTQFPKGGEKMVFDVDGIPPVELKVEP